jgi:hypothetical protein
VPEVEAILGPGIQLSLKEVPTAVVPRPGVKVRKDRPGGPWATQIDYPTEDKPAVQGERFLRWESDGDEVILGFKDGRVIDKYYWNCSL